MSATRIRRIVARGFAHAPRVTYALTAAVDWPFWLGASPTRSLPLPPDWAELPIDDVRAAARTGWSASARYRLIASTLGSNTGTWPHFGMVTLPDITDWRPPLLLATLHIGPIYAHGALLHALPGHAAALTAGLPSRPGLTAVASGYEQWQRARALLVARRALSDGEYVFAAVDGQADRRVEAGLLGRRVSLGAGMFTMARIARVPIVPLAARWRGGRIEIVAGAQIAPDAEPMMAQAFARFFEEFVLAWPRDLGPAFINLLRQSPPLDMRI